MRSSTPIKKKAITLVETYRLLGQTYIAQDEKCTEKEIKLSPSFSPPSLLPQGMNTPFFLTCGQSPAKSARYVRSCETDHIPLKNPPAFSYRQKEDLVQLRFSERTAMPEFARTVPRALKFFVLADAGNKMKDEV